VKVHDCPKCNTYSGECMKVIKNAPTFSEELLKCTNCFWSGKWSDMTVREVKLPEIPVGITNTDVEPIIDYYVLHSDEIRISYSGGSCPHCGGSDPLCWCMTL